MTPKVLLHGASRKGAKDAKFGEIGKYFSLRSLRSWRLGAKNFVEVVLLNILSVRIYYSQFLSGYKYKDQPYARGSG